MSFDCFIANDSEMFKIINQNNFFDFGFFKLSFSENNCSAKNDYFVTYNSYLPLAFVKIFEG